MRQSFSSTRSILKSSPSPISNVREPSIISSGLDPTLAQIIIDGISIVSNRPILRQWLDFVSVTLDGLQVQSSPSILSICDAITDQIRQLVLQFGTASVVEFNKLSTSSLELAFLPVLEKALSIASTGLSSVMGTGRMEPEAVADEGRGLLGYVSNVFSTESEVPALRRDDQEVCPAVSARSRCL
jgi:hypothetical protein